MKLNRYFFIAKYIIIFTLNFSLYADVSYKKIDEHAANVPKKYEKSLDELVKYLIKPANNNHEKTRAIFKWITLNIEYDTKSFFSGRSEIPSEKSVLRSKRAVCEGYAFLFNKMSELANIKSRKIQGYSKGYGYSAGSDIFNKPNHAWNAVEIEGKWRLLDATWGAGYIDEKKKFVRRFQEHYFLTDPEKFIYDHYPVEDKWQLLEKPVDKNQYLNFAYLRPSFFYSGLSILNYPEGTIKAYKEINVQLKSEKNALIMARLIKNESPLAENLTFTQKNNDIYNIGAYLPQKGEYILRIYSKLKTQKGLYEWALDYKVIVEKKADEAALFPLIYNAFRESDSFLYEPMNKKLKKNQSAYFKLKTPRAFRVVVIDGSSFNELKKKGDIFEGEIKIKSNDVVIAAQFPGKKSFDHLLKYTGH
ncbi:MAG: hypothetical protein OEZ13_00145 [Spirochaetia bacterium]|nr:hypothetical protein [Spirochaetia bacterium]